MKNRILLIAAMLLLVAAAGRTGAATGGGSGAAQPSAAQEKDQYQKSMEERFRKIGKDLDGLAAKVSAKASTMSKETKTDLDRGIADAKAKEKDASAKLDQMRKKSVKSWKKFVSETDAAMNEFEKAYERAKAHYKE